MRAKTFQYAFGFCSYVPLGANEPAEYDVGPQKLILNPKWRIRGQAELLKVGMAEKLYLMGTADEVRVYKEYIVQHGIEPGRIEMMSTDQSTAGNAKDLHKFLEQNHIRSGDWMLTTSDYHVERAVLTARINHYMAVDDAYGTEEILFENAMKRGGVMELEQLRQEFEDTVDMAQLARRITWEKRGCAQLRIKAETYKPQK